MRILNSEAIISISPVSIFGLIASSLLLARTPFIARTYSLLTCEAFAWSSGSVSLLNTTCMIPLLSLSVTKISFPRSLLLCTHPMTTTSRPTSDTLSSVQRCVLFKPFMLSAIYICLS